jgi:hypothetical protein
VQQPSTDQAPPATEGAGTVDYDLHGIARIRLVDASPGDVAAVTRQLGPLRAEVKGEPDVEVRFVERLPLSGPLRYLDYRDSGFTDDAFLVLRGPGKAQVKVQVPLDRAGGRCEIVCETGLPGVPLLVPVLNYTALAKGVLPLHAAAFTYEGTGVLVTGWAKGGKTETLLAFMANGARYVGDEWVYVSPRGERLHGIPEPIKLWDWHLPDLPQYRALLGRGGRARLRGLLAAERVSRAVGRAAGGRPARALDRVSWLLESQRWVNVHPERLFGQAACALEGPLDKVFLVVSDEQPDVRVEEIDAREVARRMVFSLEFERLDLRAAYLKFRFAFPELSNPILEDSERVHAELLDRALSGKEACAVYHPFPARIPALFDAIAPLL